MSPWRINQLGKAVLQGAIFAYPTDTIWGFGCHPLNASSVYRILDIKQRSPDKGLILLSSSLSHFLPYLGKNLDIENFNRLEQITDQPTTWLVETDEFCPRWLRGRFTTIAIRLTDHPFVQRLCDSIEAPLVSTSANRTGRPTIRNALQARRQFGTELDFIVEGFYTERNRASKIKSLTSNQIIRAQ